MKRPTEGRTVLMPMPRECGVTCTLLADISQPAEQASRRRIVVRQVDEQTQCLNANLLAMTVFVRGPKPSDIDTQPIIILPRTQFGPACLVSLADVHMTGDRLPRRQAFSRSGADARHRGHSA